MIFKNMLSKKRTGKNTKQNASTIDITHPAIVPKSNIIAIHILKKLLDNKKKKKIWIILDFDENQTISNKEKCYEKQKILKLLILILSITNVFNIYVMNYNSDSVNYLLIHTLSRYSCSNILSIAGLLCMILEPLIKEPLKRNIYLIYVSNFNKHLFSNKIFLKNGKRTQKLIKEKRVDFNE